MMKFVWEENSSCRADFSMANAAKIVKQIFPEAVSPRLRDFLKQTQSKILKIMVG